jgi:hypothetical protein
LTVSFLLLFFISFHLCDHPAHHNHATSKERERENQV